MSIEAAEATLPAVAPEAPASTGTAAPAAAAAPASTLDITKYINTDGTFKENWMEGLVPEEMKDSKFYKIFSDLPGLVKAAGHKEIELGKYRAGKGVLPITEKSSPAEISAYRAAMGVPQDPAGYKFTPPEDISSEDLSPEFTKAAFGEMHKANLSQPQADVIMNLYTNHLREVEKFVDEDLAKRVSEADAKFRGEYGTQADARLELANQFIRKMAGGWSDEKYNSLFGREVQVETADGKKSMVRMGGINDPEFADVKVGLLDLFATIEEKYGTEDTSLMPDGTGIPAKSIQAQLDEADKAVYDNTSLKASLNSKDRAKYEELINLRDKLYKRLYPE